MYSTIQYITIVYSTIQCITIVYTTIHYNCVQYNIIHYICVQYNTIHYNYVLYNTIHYNYVQCNTIQCNYVQFKFKFVYLGTRRHPEWVSVRKVLSKVLIDIQKKLDGPRKDFRKERNTWEEILEVKKVKSNAKVPENVENWFGDEEHSDSSSADSEEPAWTEVERINANRKKKKTEETEEEE